MVSPENGNWIYDLIEDFPVHDANFCNPDPRFNWPVHALNVPSNVSVNIESTLPEAELPKDVGSKKRARPESSGPSSSKACREKLRRDRLNDKFVELSSILEPGRPVKTDKAAILVDAARMVTQLRSEAEKLKDSNSGLMEKIKELKTEKNELRDEKQKLKTEKEKLEQQLKSMNSQPTYMPTPQAFPAAFAPHAAVPGGKFMPFVSYPGVAMWQFAPQAAADNNTSQDDVARLA